MNVNAIGERSKPTGFSTAFELHARALQACVESVNLYSFGERVTTPPVVGYFHGPSAKVSACLRHERNIGYLVCESSELSKSHLQAIASVDEVWTCSEYCAEILRGGGKTVKVVPHYASQSELVLSENEQPVLLVPFNAESRLLRKNPALSIKAIATACPGSKVVVKGLNLTPSVTSWLRSVGKNVELEFVTNSLSQEELDALYSRVDVVVSLHSSEGFGLHLLEAMAKGKVVVASAWGGNTDFMTKESSFLVPCDIVKAEDDFFKGFWGQADFAQAVEAVKSAVEVCNDLEFAKKVKAQANKFSFENTVNLTRKALE